MLECSRLIKIKEKDLLFKVDLTKFTEIFNQVFDGLDFTDYNFAVNEFNSAIKTFIDQLEKDTTQSIKLRIDQIEESLFEKKWIDVQNLFDTLIKKAGSNFVFTDSLKKQIQDIISDIEDDISEIELKKDIGKLEAKAIIILKQKM